MKFARIAAIAVLVFLGVGAAGGSIPLILDPTGRMMGMPISFLRHTPFTSFLIPGILLLVCNGLFCFWVLYLTVLRRKSYGWWVAAQGSVLVGWISCQVAFLRAVGALHYLYWAIGLVLIVLGLALRNDRREA